jgi:bifunctional non-homologous end joining protein LigD
VTSTEPLDRYRAKRNFEATPEPTPDVPAAPDPSGLPRFVVQEHHARRLHWDLRLERDGVLVSWAVPKGIPPDPATNHLAVHTEDHPISYLEFEGDIPKGNYGAGRMTIWDRGTYDCEKWWPSEVIVVLHGERVRGRYILFQTNEEQWLIHRMDPPQDADRQPMPSRIEPMQATPGELPADDGEFGFEISWDGLRALVFAHGGRVRVQGSTGADLTAEFPELAPLGRVLGATEVILDGELIVPGDDGRPSAERLERRLAAAARSHRTDLPVTYMAYDLLYLDGRLTLDQPYAERRKVLEGLGLGGSHWQVPSSHVGDGAVLLDLARQRGLVGIIAKRLDSPYRPGTVSLHWIDVRAS